MPEQQNIEYKSSWHDEFLKWICGFANAQGGKIFIGMDDKGTVIGVNDYKKLMDEIPNKSVNHLGLIIDVNLHTESGRHYIEIDVPVSTVPISYHGIHYYRSGSTKQELKGIAFQNWLLKKYGRHWEDIPVLPASLDDLDEATIRLFVGKAIEKGRISVNAANDSISTLLENLNLITKDGYLTNAALLVFGKKLLQVTASFKIGRFGKEIHDLQYQDVIETNLFNMPDKVMEKLKDKYLIRPISYKGLERIESLEYPEQALREAILNAIIHKDYSSTWIFLRVMDDRLEIWNPGNLPEELTIEKLKGKHSSYPRNRNIADIFFRAGYIESWGRGTNKIIDTCIEAGLPEPIIQQYENGISVLFLKDIYNEEYFEKLRLNKRQIKAVLFTKEKGSITNSQFQEINSVGKSVSTIDLQDLVVRNIITQQGKSGRAVKYVLKILNEQ